MTNELKIIKKPERIFPQETDIEVLTAEQADALQKEKKRQARQRATGKTLTEKIAQWNYIISQCEKVIKDRQETIKTCKKKIKRASRIMDEAEEL